jgi:hypothetical protein
MKQPTINNLSAQAHGHYSSLSIHWEDAGYRYHFWMNDLQTAEREVATGDTDALEFTVYRNSRADTITTRLLASNKGYSARVLPLILPEVPALVAAALDVHRAERVAADMSRAEAIKAQRVRDAAPQLLAALEEIAFGQFNGGATVADLQYLARAALSVVKGEPV